MKPINVKDKDMQAPDATSRVPKDVVEAAASRDSANEHYLDWDIFPSRLPWQESNISGENVPSSRLVNGHMLNSSALLENFGLATTKNRLPHVPADQLSQEVFAKVKPEEDGGFLGGSTYFASTGHSRRSLPDQFAIESSQSIDSQDQVASKRKQSRSQQSRQSQKTKNKTARRHTSLQNEDEEDRNQDGESLNDNADNIDDGSSDDDNDKDEDEEDNPVYTTRDKKSSSKGNKKSLALKRNRISARKCRKKKQQGTSNLVDEKEHLEVRNTHLTQCAQFLQNEVTVLKMKLLEHGNCDCKLIQHYIGHEAQRIANRASDLAASTSRD